VTIAKLAKLMMMQLLLNCMQCAVTSRCIDISDCPASDELHVALAQQSALQSGDYKSSIILTRESCREQIPFQLRPPHLLSS
jgi:hypothetical protein